MRKAKLWLCPLAAVIIFLFCTAGCGFYAEDVSSDPTSFAETASSEAVSGDFSVLFIDVGQADSALVECSGSFMLIDGGNAADSDIIYTVLKKHGVKELEYLVVTHAHEDHVGGASAAFEACTVGTVLCPVTSYSSKTFQKFMSQVEKHGNTVTVPSVGDSFALGESTVTVLGPVAKYDEPNNTSIVLKIEYGDTSFLFMGDAERESELDILDTGADLSATLLKVGHHGSSTSTSYPFLREVMPEYAVISCGKGNSYGHPHEETLSRLSDASVTVYRTDLSGDITCTSDGKQLSFTFAKQKNS